MSKSTLSKSTAIKSRLRLGFLTLLLAAAAVGFVQLGETPAQASDCEFYCTQRYEQCLAYGIFPGACRVQYDNCLDDCP